MKKALMIIIMFALLSCEKDNPQPNNTPSTTQNCNCGVIVQQDTYTATSGSTMYIYNKYKVKNDCTSNVSDWHMSNDTYTTPNNKVGVDLCLSYEW